MGIGVGKFGIWYLKYWNLINAGVAQLVERQPSKLNVAGSNPVSRSNTLGELVIECCSEESAVNIKITQLPKSRRSSGVERFLGKEEVTGSNPVIGSLKKKLN